jgi:hypothetical protein
MDGHAEIGGKVHTSDGIRSMKQFHPCTRDPQGEDASMVGALVMDVISKSISENINLCSRWEIRECNFVILMALDIVKMMVIGS